MPGGAGTGWPGIAAAIDGLAAGADAVSPRVAENARRLLARMRDRPAPDEAGRGYWPTIRLTWTADPPSEIEIHDDRYELYRFRDRATDITTWCCGPDGDAPDLLDRLIAATFEGYPA